MVVLFDCPFMMKNKFFLFFFRSSFALKNRGCSKCGYPKKETNNEEMEFCSFTFTGKHGLTTKNSSVAIEEGDVVHFLVTKTKQPNYLDYCNQIVASDDPVKTINQYTEHKTELYAKVGKQQTLH